jgi:hypothetical protein
MRCSVLLSRGVAFGVCEGLRLVLDRQIIYHSPTYTRTVSGTLSENERVVRAVYNIYAYYNE